MEHHYPDLLLAGYSDDTDLVAEKLTSYPGKLHRVHEDAASNAETSELADAWGKAVVVYIFSKDTGYSSQLKSLFDYLKHRLQSNTHVAILLTGVHPNDMIFPELESIPRISVENIECLMSPRWISSLSEMASSQ